MSEDQWLPVVDGERPPVPEDGHVDVRWKDGDVWRGRPVAYLWGAWPLFSHYRIAPPAKAEREPSGTTWFSKPAPRWVRCDDRLPGDGREYQARWIADGQDNHGDRLIRVVAEKLEFTITGASWVHYSGAGLEWLDEAPAQEGQEVQRESAASSRKQMPEQSGQRQPDSHPYPAGTLTRAMRQRAAREEIVAQIQDLRAFIGNGRRY